jgi:DNA-binding NarL/FixJ family response regulator
MRGRSIMVVEDDRLLRELIASSLEQRGFSVDTAASAADARRAFRRADFDGCVIDVELGPGPNGFDLADILRREAPALAIVFLTNLPDPRFAAREPGSLPSDVAYLRKTDISDIGVLEDALDATLRGGQPLVRHDFNKQRPLVSLTAKQFTAVRLVAQGMTNQQIADEQGLSVKAIEDTLRRAFAAMGLDSDLKGNPRVTAARQYLAIARGVDPRAQDEELIPN